MNTDFSATPTRYWTRLDDGRVQCDVCPRRCRLHEGQRGLCFVRGRERDGIELYTYGRSSGFCVDPIEKKPLQPLPARLVGAVVRHRGLQPRLQVLPELGHEQVARDGHARGCGLAEASWRRRRSRLGCASVAFTYNDPTVFMEYAIDVAEACHDAGVRTVAVTAGYICPEPRAEFFACDGRGQRRPQGIHRALLSQGLRRASWLRCSTRSSI